MQGIGGLLNGNENLYRIDFKIVKSSPKATQRTKCKRNLSRDTIR